MGWAGMEVSVPVEHSPRRHEAIRSPVPAYPCHPCDPWFQLRFPGSAGTLRFAAVPEEPEWEEGEQREESGEGEAEVVGSGAFDDDSEYALGLGWNDPGGDASDPGDLALMFAGQVLGEGVIKGEHAEGTGGYHGEDDQQRGALGQPGNGRCGRAEKAASGEDPDAGRMDTHAAAGKPGGEGTRGDAADVGGTEPCGVEVERLRFGVAPAFLKEQDEPGAKDLPRGVDAGDGAKDHQHPRTE